MDSVDQLLTKFTARIRDNHPYIRDLEVSYVAGLLRGFEYVCEASNFSEIEANAWLDRFDDDLRKELSQDRNLMQGN